MFIFYKYYLAHTRPRNYQKMEIAFRNYNCKSQMARTQADKGNFYLSFLFSNWVKGLQGDHWPLAYLWYILIFIFKYHSFAISFPGDKIFWEKQFFTYKFLSSRFHLWLVPQAGIKFSMASKFHKFRVFLSNSQTVSAKSF